MTGKVYFISAPGRIKVGHTRKPEERLAQLRAVDMEPLTTIAVIDGSRKLERAIHDRIRPYAIRGEWFRDCSEVREAINDAIAGLFSIDEEPSPAVDPLPSDHSPSVSIDEQTVNAAVRRCYSLSDEVLVRIALSPRADISGIVAEMTDIATRIIAPSLGAARTLRNVDRA
jgi:hypothetical protein